MEKTTETCDACGSFTKLLHAVTTEKVQAALICRSCLEGGMTDWEPLVLKNQGATRGRIHPDARSGYTPKPPGVTKPPPPPPPPPKKSSTPERSPEVDLVRAYLAGCALPVILHLAHRKEDQANATHPMRVGQLSVAYADAVLAELEKPDPEDTKEVEL